LILTAISAFLSRWTQEPKAQWRLDKRAEGRAVRRLNNRSHTADAESWAAAKDLLDLTVDNLRAAAHGAAAEAIMEIEQEIAMLSARMRFAQEYSAAKGWDFADLKVEQMLEIRAQQGWRTPALPPANA
jgi:hypothetical protein